MPKKKEQEEAYHCDGYYFNGACEFRGQPDVADGSLKNFCDNYGLNKHDKLCRHCVENRKYFRAEAHQINGKCISLTPLQAKEHGTAKTIRAFAESEMSQFITFLIENKSLYGVNVKTGDIISAPAI